MTTHKKVTSETTVLGEDAINQMLARAKQGSTEAEGQGDLIKLAQSASEMAGQLSVAQAAAQGLETQLKQVTDQGAELTSRIDTMTTDLKAAQDALAAAQVENQALSEANQKLAAEIAAERKVGEARSQFFKLRAQATQLRQQNGLTPAKFAQLFGSDDAAAEELLIQHIKGTASCTLGNLEFLLGQMEPQSIYPNIDRSSLDVYPRPGEDASGGRVQSDGSEEALAQAAVDQVIARNYGKPPARG